MYNCYNQLHLLQSLYNNLCYCTVSLYKMFIIPFTIKTPIITLTYITLYYCYN